MESSSPPELGEPSVKMDLKVKTKCSPRLTQEDSIKTQKCVRRERGSVDIQSPRISGAPGAALTAAITSRAICSY